MNKKNMPRCFTALSATAFTLACLLNINMAYGQNQSDIGLIPVADYATEKAAKPDNRSTHYNNQRNEPISELPAGIDELPLNAHWWQGLSALPVSRSDAVIIGKVVNAQAHLSNDKTGVYSEFTVHIEEVLKNPEGRELPNDSSIIIDRFGGGVRFPSGKIQYYRIAQQGMPRVGSRYVLFLKKTSEASFSILTGYELSSGVVRPLDGAGCKKKDKQLPFDLYCKSDEMTFFEELRSNLANRPAGSEKGARHEG